MRIPFKYNLRSLFVRKGTTLMTMGSIAFVVLVFVGVLSLASGLEQAFAASGDPRNVLVLRDGSRSETESFFSLENHRMIAALPGVESDASGQQMASGELVVLQIFQRGDGSESNVVLRGVMPGGFAIRPSFAITEGRTFEPGKGEILVGKNLVGRFPSLALGRDIQFGRLTFRVVGVFDAGGGSANSEVWVPFEDLGNAFRRSNNVSTTRLRTSSADAARALVTTIKGDQRFRVKPMLETEYYAEQAAANTSQFKFLGIFLAVLMGFGACFAAANTMYSQVATRSREIGTLRAIGFRRRTVLIAFLIEAALLGLLGGLVGVVLALPLNGLSAGTTNFVTFSEVTFQLATTPDVLTGGVLLAVLTGLLGGFPPAWAASRRQIAGLLREA